MRTTVKRLLFLPLLALFLMPLAARAHHGLMIWDDETLVTIEGFVSEEMDGFPHWEITVRTPDGTDWKIDVGDEFKLKEAGIDPRIFQIGTEIRVEGNLPADEPDAHLLRPLRITVEGMLYEFKGVWN